jgi:hypothetical protein
LITAQESTANELIAIAVMDIEVTPAMIRAGGDALCSFDFEWDSIDLKVEAVYRAMRVLEPRHVEEPAVG